MTLIKTTDKWTAVHAMINTWLKDTQVYCGNCDADYNKEFFPCCEEPVLGNNFDHCNAIVQGIKEAKKSHINDYASNKKKNFRATVSLPRRLYHLLNTYFKKQNMKLFKDDKEVQQFAKRFKMFQIPIKM